MTGLTPIGGAFPFTPLEVNAIQIHQWSESEWTYFHNLNIFLLIQLTLSLRIPKVLINPNPPDGGA